jgi:nucleoside-diphosphate-sugar epimerase
MVLPTFVLQALEGAPITVFGNGEQSRCFGYVEDAVEAIVRLMTCDRAIGEVVNIGNTEEITMGQLAQLVKDLARSNSAIQFIPYDEAYAPGFEDMMRRVPSVDKLYSLTGFRVTTTLTMIIDQVIGYMRNEREVAARTTHVSPS